MGDLLSTPSTPIAATTTTTANPRNLEKPAMPSSASETLETEAPATSKTLETKSSATLNPAPPPENNTVENQTTAQVSNSSIDSKIAEDRNPEVSDQSNVSRSEEDGEESGGEEDEEGECGFCLFMKGGECRESFIAWEKCVEDAEKNKEDIVEKCFEVTGLLKKCMDAHSDYYEPVLRAERAAEEEAIKELEREAASKESEQATGTKG